VSLKRGQSVNIVAEFSRWEKEDRDCVINYESEGLLLVCKMLLVYKCSADTSPEPFSGAETPDDAEDSRGDGGHDGSSNNAILGQPDPNDESYKGAEASEHEDEIESVVDCLITTCSSKAPQQRVAVTHDLDWNGLAARNASSQTVGFIENLLSCHDREVGAQSDACQAKECRGQSKEDGGVTEPT